jgi:hypothetical protein
VSCPKQDAPDVQGAQADAENTVHVQIKTEPETRRAYADAASVPREVRHVV